MEAYIEKISELSAEIDPEKYGQIYGLQSYYDVYSDEHTWTGDILEKDGEYAIVITPACDFAQCKRRPLDFIKIISSIRINHDDLTDLERLNEIKTKLKIKARRKEVPKAILVGTRALPERFYVLKYIKDSQTGLLFHLAVDFQRVSNLPFSETAVSLEEQGWKRVCRIDTPIIDNLLQEYSAYSSRIGIQTIPNNVVKSTIDKIKNN